MSPEIEFPIGAAVTVKFCDNRGPEFVDGWVVGYLDGRLILRRDLDNKLVSIDADRDRVRLVEGPVQSTWQAASRIPVEPGTRVADMTREQRIWWYLREITQEYQDPSQRRYDLESLAQLILESSDVRGCSCGMADYGAPGHDGDPNGGHADS